MSDRLNTLTKEEKNQMEELIVRGQMIVFPERVEQWEEYVEKSFSEKYKGQDAAEALQIIEALNRGIGLDKAKEMLTEIEPNGEANGLVRRAVLLFANHGPEFWKETSEGHISLRTRFQLFRIRRRNEKLTKMYQFMLPAGDEKSKDQETITDDKKVEDKSKSWVLGDDEMQIVVEQQRELAQRTNKESQSQTSEIDTQDVDR